MISQNKVIIKSLVRKVKMRTQSFVLEIVLLIKSEKGGVLKIVLDNERNVKAKNKNKGYEREILYEGR